MGHYSIWITYMNGWNIYGKLVGSICQSHSEHMRSESICWVCFSSLGSRIFFRHFNHGNPQPSCLGVITHILGVQNLDFSRFWGPKEDSWTMFLFWFFHVGPSEIHFTQVVQFVTKLYPLFGGHLDLAIERVTWTHHPKKVTSRIARTVKFHVFLQSPLRQSYHSMWTHHAAQIALSAFVRKPDLIREDFVISGKGGWFTPKFNMEPENASLEKKQNLKTTSFGGSMLNFRGVQAVQSPSENGIHSWDLNTMRFGGDEGHSNHHLSI